MRCVAAAAGTQNIKLNILKFDLRERRKRLRSVWANVLLMRIGSVAAACAAATAAAAHARADEGAENRKFVTCVKERQRRPRGTPANRGHTQEVTKTYHNLFHGPRRQTFFIQRRSELFFMLTKTTSMSRLALPNWEDDVTEVYPNFKTNSWQRIVHFMICKKINKNVKE